MNDDRSGLVLFASTQIFEADDRAFDGYIIRYEIQSRYTGKAKSFRIVYHPRTIAGRHAVIDTYSYARSATQYIMEKAKIEEISSKLADEVKQIVKEKYSK